MSRRERRDYFQFLIWLVFVDDSFNSIHEFGNIEVDEITKFLTRQFQISECLFGKNGFKDFNRFQFDDDFVINQ